jgi:hypothetical protein
MAKATEDLLEIRAAFEDMERKMSSTMKTSVEKRGLSASADIMADVARIREELRTLHIKLDNIA